MSMFKEVQETDKPIETEKQRLSTAFENNKKNEGGETRHLKTINEQYEGQKYPGTDVEYKHERIQVNGEKVEGVFHSLKAKMWKGYLEKCGNLRMHSSFRFVRRCWDKNWNIIPL